MGYYTAVLFSHNWFANEGTYTITREVQTCDLKVIFEYLTSEGKVKKRQVDTILLLKNGKHSPEVVDVWSSKAGSFNELWRTAVSDISLHIQKNMTPDERKLFIINFCGHNPHYRGAHVADILEILYDTDSHVEKTDAMYEAHKADIDQYQQGLYSMCVFVALYLGKGTEWETISGLMQRFNTK